MRSAKKSSSSILHVSKALNNMSHVKKDNAFHVALADVVNAYNTANEKEKLAGLSIEGSVWVNILTLKL